MKQKECGGKSKTKPLILSVRAILIAILNTYDVGWTHGYGQSTLLSRLLHYANMLMCILQRFLKIVKMIILDEINDFF